MTAHATERLSAYLDGELSAAERQAIDAHLRLCRDCARHLEDLAVVDDLARSLPLEAPAGYFESLPARVRFKVAARPRRGFALPAWSWAVAAAALLAVIAPRVLDRRPGPASVPAPGAVARNEAPATAVAGPKAPAPTATVAPAASEPERKPAPGGPSPADRGREAERRDAGARDALEARDERGFAGPPAAPPPAQNAPAARAFSKAEEQPARPQAAAPSAAGRLAAPPEAALAEAPEPSPEGAAAQHLPAPDLEKDVAEAAPTAETKKQDRVAVGQERAAAGATLSDANGGMKLRPAMLYRSLLALSPADAEQARRVRERWRAFLKQSPPAPEADEARVRIVEMGVKAWRFSNDPADLTRLRQDAEAYLRRDDAAQGDRVRQLLETTGN